LICVVRYYNNRSAHGSHGIDWSNEARIRAGEQDVVESDKFSEVTLVKNSNMGSKGPVYDLIVRNCTFEICLVWQ
jgi:hypothetical protein